MYSKTFLYIPKVNHTYSGSLDDELVEAMQSCDQEVRTAITYIYNGRASISVLMHLEIPCMQNKTQLLLLLYNM